MLELSGGGLSVRLSLRGSPPASGVPSPLQADRERALSGPAPSSAQCDNVEAAPAGKDGHPHKDSLVESHPRIESPAPAPDSPVAASEAPPTTAPLPHRMPRGAAILGQAAAAELRGGEDGQQLAAAHRPAADPTRQPDSAGDGGAAASEESEDESQEEEEDLSDYFSPAPGGLGAVHGTLGAAPSPGFSPGMSPGPGGLSGRPPSGRKLRASRADHSPPVGLAAGGLEREGGLEPRASPSTPTGFGLGFGVRRGASHAGREVGRERVDFSQPGAVPAVALEQPQRGRAPRWDSPSAGLGPSGEERGCWTQRADSIRTEAMQLERRLAALRLELVYVDARARGGGALRGGTPGPSGCAAPLAAEAAGQGHVAASDILVHVPSPSAVSASPGSSLGEPSPA